MHKILKNSIIVLLGEKVTMGDCQKKRGGGRESSSPVLKFTVEGEKVVH